MPVHDEGGKQGGDVSFGLATIKRVGNPTKALLPSWRFGEGKDGFLKVLTQQYTIRREGCQLRQGMREMDGNKHTDSGNRKFIIVSLSPANKTKIVSDYQTTLSPSSFVTNLSFYSNYYIPPRLLQGVIKPPYPSQQLPPCRMASPPTNAFCGL